MKIYLKYIAYIILALLFILVFRTWFIPGLITGGDFWPYFNSQYSLHSIFQYAWNSNIGNGLGNNSVPYLWILLNFGFFIEILGDVLKLNWETIQRVAYLFPVIIVSGFSSLYLYRRLFPKNNLYIFAPLIFIFNTYFLMVVGGGQIPGIGMAYSLIPLIFLLYFELNKKWSLVKILELGAILSLQLLFDLRIFYITSFALLVFCLFNLRIKNLIKGMIVFSSPFFIVLLLHSFWILPLILFPVNPLEDLGMTYSSTEAVRFFSFAKLENSLSLLHPNWPENIFGKTGFMRPEFLFLPVFAFSSILFIKKDKKNKKVILFFTLLALVGAFLAKGVNEPFGQVYIWLFENFPGFQMFRDPTKWYVLIALSYSILVPYSLERIYLYLKEKTK